MKRVIKAASSKDLAIKVYMDSVNYRNEIIDHVLIATFKSENWAKDFIENLPDYPNTQYTIINNGEELVR